MDLGPLRALALTLNLQAHGVPVTVTRPAPNDDPIETRGIWLTTLTESVPSGTDFQRREPFRVMALSRAIVPTAPRGTEISAPEKAGDVTRTWIVDSTDRVEADHVRVIVLPVDEG